MKLTLVFNRKGCPRNDGTALIQFRARHKGKYRYYSSNIHILPRQWKNNKVVDHPEARELNRRLKQILRDAEIFILKQDSLGRPLNFQQLDRFFRYKDHSDFLEFCYTELKADNGLQEATKRQHRVTLGYLERYAGSISFGDLDYTLIHGFNNFLLGLEICQNTIHSHHKRLKRYINLAVKKGLFDRESSPYKHFTVKRGTARKVVLSKEELHLIEVMEIPREKLHLQTIRDIFLLGCYTGLRFSDLASIRRTQIFQTNSKTILKIKAQKTKKEIDLPLHILHDGKPESLVNFWMQDNPRRLQLFPKITNQYANRCLKEIASLIHTEKRLTMHVARHTFATHLALKVKPALLQKLLQHSDLKTTMIYVNLSEQMLIDELKKVNW